MKKIIEKYEDGTIKTERYVNTNGATHREDGPAILWYHMNGKIKCESYYNNGKIHREDGPAFIEYNIDGTIKDELYYLNGKFHFTQMIKKGWK